MTFWSFILAYLIGYSITETVKAVIVHYINKYKYKKSLEKLEKVISCYQDMFSFPKEINTTKSDIH